jgi:hypothetical protein
VRIDGIKITGTVMLVAVAVLFLWAVRKSGGLPVPERNVTEALAFVAEPLQPNLARPDLSTPGRGMVYTKHRYPRVCGQELTTIIHYGHSRASVPAAQDSNWITAPPSEVTI